MTMTMITHRITSLQQSADLPKGPERLGCGPSQFGEEKTRAMQHKFNNVFPLRALPLQAKWAWI